MHPFTGNPAAVCLLPYTLPGHACAPGKPLSDATMLAIADEMNLSETAFVQVRAAVRIAWRACVILTIDIVLQSMREGDAVFQEDNVGVLRGVWFSSRS